jgi:predicted metalloprotease
MALRCRPSGSAPGRIRAALALLIGLTLALTGCTISVSEGPPPAAPSDGGTETGVDQPVGSDADQRPVDERTAVGVVDRYWQRHFGELTGRRYESPQVAGPYAGTSGPACGGQPSVPGNAFYCPAGDFLAWDEDLMRAGYDRIGDAWVYLIISHEWGHAIQARLRRGQVSVAAELQADCLSGAALLGAVNDGDLRLEQGDEEEIAQTLAVVADDFPWTDSRSHGNAEQRTSAFEAGANNGPRACT